MTLGWRPGNEATVVYAHKHTQYGFVMRLINGNATCMHTYIHTHTHTHTVASCLRDLRSEALVFMAGIVKHITTVAVVQQCSKQHVYSSLYS